MPVSERKPLLRAALGLGLAGILFSLGVAGAVALGLVTPAGVQRLLVPLLFLGLGVFALAALLFHELARLLHGPPNEYQPVQLSLAEMKLLLHWCPGPARLAFSAAGLLFVGTLVFLGDVDWSAGQPACTRQALGVPLFAAVFMLAALPVLASAARMPGRFADHLEQRQRDA